MIQMALGVPGADGVASWMFSKVEKASKGSAERSKVSRGDAWFGCMKAFPGDTYISDLKRASKTGKAWTRLLGFAVLLSVIADFYLLQDAFAWMLGEASVTDILADGGSLLQVAISPSVFVCVALVVLYLVFSDIAGKKLAEFRAFHGASSLFAFLLLLLVLMVVLAFIAMVRFESIIDEVSVDVSGGFAGGFGGGDAFGGAEDFGFSASSGFGAPAQDDLFDPFADFWALSSSDRVSALIRTALITSVMMLGAFLEMVRSYCSFNPYAGEKLRLAEGCIAEDRRLYMSVYAQHAADPVKNLGYEEKERELDREAVACSFRISELAAQLNGIVDPADAHDFCAVSRLVTNGKVG